MKVVKTTYICDRCGFETENSEDKRSDVSGCMSIKYSGHTGHAAYTGDWGGSNIEGDIWVCYDCTKAFTEWLKPPTPEKKVGE